jgi:hypothetical protein
VIDGAPDTVTTVFWAALLPRLSLALMVMAPVSVSAVSIRQSVRMPMAQGFLRNFDPSERMAPDGSKTVKNAITTRVLTL